jgi:hypothetical protein
MRTTRSKARAAAAAQLDNTDAANPTILPASREPLRSITPNSVDSGDIEKPADDDTTMPAKKEKGKGKKAARSKKGGKNAKNAIKSSASVVDDDGDGAVLVRVAVDNEKAVGDNTADLTLQSPHEEPRNGTCCCQFRRYYSHPCHKSCILSRNC